MWHIKYSLIYIYIYNLNIFSQCYCNFLALLLFALFFFFFWGEVNLQKQAQIEDAQFCSLLFFFIFFPFTYLQSIYMLLHAWLKELRWKTVAGSPPHLAAILYQKLKPPFIYIYIYISITNSITQNHHLSSTHKPWLIHWCVFSVAVKSSACMHAWVSW